jgi:hypothetical protein
MSDAGAQPVAAAGQLAVGTDAEAAEPTPGGAPPATPAAAKAKTKARTKQSTLGFANARASVEVTAPLGPTLGERAEVARTALAAAAAARLSSPTTKIRVGWLVEGEKARCKGTKEVVTVYAHGPPLEYYVQPGLRKQTPKNQLRCVALKMIYVLTDGKARRAISGGKGMLCGHCFALLRMPQFGEENLRCHLASSACGAAEWCNVLTTALNNDRPADDRRRVIQADDRSVLVTDTKMRFHFKTAIMYASTGTLPTTLFDNETFVSWVRDVTQGAYRPPSARWLTPELGPAIDLMVDMCSSRNSASSSRRAGGSSRAWRSST